MRLQLPGKVSGMVKIKRATHLSELEQTSKEMRKSIFEFKTQSGYGHLASCLSIVDVLVSLYFDVDSAFDLAHDRVIFSKGHGSPAIYPILVKLGHIPSEELTKYCEETGILRLHADYSIPGCLYVGGSLGNGIGFAAGLALARSHQHFYVILGDAELQEGSVWESLLFINQHKLKNITLIVDRNGFGITGSTESSLKLESLKDKFEAFGFDTLEIDGHNFDALRGVFSRKPNSPRVVIAQTIKGKGVSYMEGKYEFHTIIPKDKGLIQQGLKELS